MSGWQALIDTLGNAFASLRDTIARCLPNAKERRRLALLQAATTIYSSAPFTIAGNSNGIPFEQWFTNAVNQAERLLAEIERRDGVAQ